MDFNINELTGNNINLDTIFDANYGDDILSSSGLYTFSSSYTDSTTEQFSYNSTISFPMGEPDSPGRPTKRGAAKRRRGRRPLRPNDPIRKKTEEKDKYWLRAFRAYMKENFQNIKPHLNFQEIVFWQGYLSNKGKPGKGNEFVSYGKLYKNYLFTNQSFVRHFQRWFIEFGEEELRRKCEPDSDRWFVFYDYGARELMNYRPTLPNARNGVQPGLPQNHIQFVRVECDPSEEFLVAEMPDNFNSLINQ